MERQVERCAYHSLRYQAGCDMGRKMGHCAEGCTKRYPGCCDDRSVGRSAVRDAGRSAVRDAGRYAGCRARRCMSYSVVHFAGRQSRYSGHEA